jgi:hypothetical protein
MGVTVWRGNPYESWDLNVVGGLLGASRVRMAVEDHGSGHQYIRLAAWPRYSKIALALSVAGAVITGLALNSGEFFVAGVLATGSFLLTAGAALEAGRSLANILAAGRQTETTAKEKTVIGFESAIKANTASRGVKQDAAVSD